MRNRSIRFKLTAWFALILAAAVGITLLAVLSASRTVLRSTVRDYLIGTVEENVDKIRYVSGADGAGVNLYIPYGGGFLEIDADFMEVVNDVHTSLCTADGAMLYGENPIPRQTAQLAFAGTCLRHIRADGVRCDLYDRRLAVGPEEGGGLWIRGIVPETRGYEQLREIARLSLILLPLLIVPAALSGYLLTAGLLAPLRRIESAAESISRGGDLKRRIDEGGSRDEAGRLALAFNRMLDRLERAFETERRFTADASHELRTPTSVILAQSEYILERERTAEEYAEAMQTVRRQGQRMSALIGDMLDYTRVDQDADRYPLGRVELSPLVAETAEQTAMAAEREAALSVQAEEGLTVRGNGLLLSRLVQNLVSNACRYGREGGHVQVRAARDGDRVVLEVEDDGAGIAEQERERIFERFYRGDASRSTPGTGLGLSMVKRIAEIHGAAVELESEPGRGSTFRIVFPADTEDV